MHRPTDEIPRADEEHTEVRAHRRVPVEFARSCQDDEVEHRRHPHRDVRGEGGRVLREDDRGARHRRCHQRFDGAAAPFFGEEAHGHRRDEHEENQIEENGVAEERLKRRLIAHHVRFAREVVHEKKEVHPLDDEKDAR